MRKCILIILFLPGYFCYSQHQQTENIHNIEGITGDIDTYNTLPFVTLRNDSLHISVTSDTSGYFLLQLPHSIFKDREYILIEITKPGYKTMRTMFTYRSDDTTSNSSGKVVWDQQVKVYWMANDKSESFSGQTTIPYSQEGIHGNSITRLAFDKAFPIDPEERLFTKLKQGNDSIYFSLSPGKSGLVTGRYDILVSGRLTHVYIDGKKINVTRINQIAKRNHIRYDRDESDRLTKKLGRETLAFATSGGNFQPAQGVHAILEIELEE